MLYFPKLIELDDLSPEGEPTIQIVRPGEYNHLYHVKTANDALDYIKQVKPIPNKTIILVLAMTAGEFYGPNRNGDAWPERPLQVGNTKITEDQVLPKHYKTFETNANVFKHHMNKDPNKKIGDVIKAFYNWPMHRVELLLALDNNHAQDLVERIENDEYPAVSMGCAPAGSMITMGDGTRKPIEDIVVDDLVLTHKGRVRRVTKTYVRKYTGDLYTIKPASGPEIILTHEHPLLVDTMDTLRPGRTDAKGRQLRTWDTNAKPAPDWVHAACLDDRHLLMVPTIQETVTPDYVTPEFARLFGAYVADGNITRNKKKEIYGIWLCVNENNPILETIDTLCKSIGTKNAPHISQHPVSKKAYRILINDPPLAKRFAELGGTLAKKKKLAASVLRWESSLQREFIGAYANGDGCGTKTGALQLSTPSQDLAWQLCMILYRLQIPPSVQCVTHKAGSGFSTNETTEYTVFVGKQWAQSLKDICYKVQPSEIRAVRNDRFFFGHNLAAPIRHITVEHVTDIDVYNFEVEEDESYVVSGVSVHNCKVKYDVCSLCGNKARSRKSYCNHAKYHLGELTRNGRKIFVWNPSPRFFDISMVRRPADKHGYMMKKVAEAIPEIRSSAILGEYVDNMERKIAGLRKMSLIDKILRGDVTAAKKDDGEVTAVKNFGDHIAQPAAQAMPPIDDQIIRGLLRYRPAEVLSTLSSMGIFLTTPEFIKYFVWKMDPTVKIPEGLLDRAVAAQGAIFDFLANNPEVLDDIEETGFTDVSPENVNPDLAQKTAFLLEKRSQIGEYLHKKLVPDIFKSTDTRKGNWDVINVTDPYTGRRFQTTRWAAREAADVGAKRQLKNLAGGGALLAGALALSPFKGLRLAAPLLAVPGAAMMYKGYRGYPSVRADSGEKVYTPTREYLGDRYDPGDPSTWSGYRGTELVEKRSSAALDETNMIIKMALDFTHRPGYRSAVVDIQKIRRLEIPSFDTAIQKIGEVICP